MIDPAQQDTAPAQLSAGLSFLFGVDPSILAGVDFSHASSQHDRLAVAARTISQRTGTAAVPLGHDVAFVQRCVDWLRERVAKEPALKGVFASDSSTLLVLSEAIDLATIRSPARRTPASVLLCGETGTGKELLARAIHDMSVAHKVVARDCFVPVHVAGLTPDFVNDELFGHVKGAFTGAQTNRDGQIQAAHGGTLLIDEVGDLSREAQLRLLRVVQDGQVARTGENTTRAVSVRLLAATNRDLAAAVGDGSFRRDLLYRLGQGWLELPPLRDRAGWNEHVVDEMLRRHGQATSPLLVRSGRDALACHDWPGNLRELDNVLEIAVANARGTPVRVEHLPRYVQARYLQAPIAVRASGDLCDDLDAQAPDASVLEPRLTGLRERIVQTATATPNADLAGVLAFHEKIPDRSPEHARTLQQLHELKDAVFERDKLIEVHNVWGAVAQRGLPHVVGRSVAGEVARAANDVQTKTTEVTAIEQAIDIARDPWWKLATDLADLPIFDATARPAVLQFIPFALGVVASISQDVADQIVARVRNGGLAALRAAAVELMREANQPVLPARFDIEKADRKQWLEWREEFPKKRDFIAACERDGKTIAKYAKMSCGGRDPWTRRPERRRSRAG